MAKPRLTHKDLVRNAKLPVYDGPKPKGFRIPEGYQRPKLTCGSGERRVAWLRDDGSYALRREYLSPVTNKQDCETYSERWTPMDPEVLDRWREWCTAIDKQLREGIDPKEAREKVQDAVKKETDPNKTMAEVIREYLDVVDAGSWTAQTKGQARGRLERFARAACGKKSMRTPAVEFEDNLLAVLKPIVKAGTHETAKRVLAALVTLGDYAVPRYMDVNWFPSLRSKLGKLNSGGQFPAIVEWKPFGQLLNAIDTHEDPISSAESAFPQRKNSLLYADPRPDLLHWRGQITVSRVVCAPA